MDIYNPKETTMTTKHTPGPWVVVEPESGHVARIREDGTWQSVASVFDADYTKMSVANALLIAAGPELLEALAEMVVHFGAVAALIAVEEEKRGVKRPRFDGIDASQKAIAMARAAIAKAEGMVR